MRHLHGTRQSASERGSPDDHIGGLIRFWPSPVGPDPLSLRAKPARVGTEGDDLMRITETKRTGTCTCRCNACKSQAHCRNMGSGCRVKL